MEKLRSRALKHAEVEAEKERWGLFSQPPPLKLGEMKYTTEFHPKDENGLPVQLPTNFYTGPPLKGKTQDVYFQPDNFLNKEQHKDPYFDYTKIHKGMKLKIEKITQNKDGERIKPEPFRPAVTKWAEYKDASNTQRLGVPYENKADCPIKKIVCRKNQDGDVMTAPMNMLHHPLRGGHYNSTYGHTICTFPKYTHEPYDVSRHADAAKNKKWQEFYKSTSSGYFRGMSAGPDVLKNDRDTYGRRPPLGKNKKTWKYVNALKHTDAMKPSNPNKSGKIEGTFSKFERLIPNPAAIHKAKFREVGPSTKEPFKPSRDRLSKPSPSITLNRMNLRSAIR